MRRSRGLPPPAAPTAPQIDVMELIDGMTNATCGLHFGNQCAFMPADPVPCMATCLQGAHTLPRGACPHGWGLLPGLPALWHCFAKCVGKPPPPRPSRGADPQNTVEDAAVQQPSGQPFSDGPHVYALDWESDAITSEGGGIRASRVEPRQARCRGLPLRARLEAAGQGMSWSRGLQQRCSSLLPSPAPCPSLRGWQRVQAVCQPQAGPAERLVHGGSGRVARGAL